MNKILKILNNILFIVLPSLVILVVNNYKYDITKIYNNLSYIILFIIYILFIVFEVKGLFNKKSISYNKKYNIVIFIFNVTTILISTIYLNLSSIYFATFYFPLFKQALILVICLMVFIILYKSLINDKGFVYNNLFFMLSWIYFFNKIINNFKFGLFTLIIFLIIYLILLKKKDGILYSFEYNSLIKKYNVIFILYVFIYKILISLFYNVEVIINKFFMVISTIFLCFIVLAFIKNIKNKYLRNILFILYYLIIILTIITGIFMYIILYVLS